jgi:hypothetical protein
MKIPASLGSLMGDPGISISSSPFAPGKVVLKRPSFPKGQVPPHLTGYLIKSGECSGQRGVVTGPRGNPIPKTAACVRERHRR